MKEKRKKGKVLVSQACPTLCDPMDPPGSSVHGILQARILEWQLFFQGDLPNPDMKPGGFFTREAHNIK